MAAMLPDTVINGTAGDDFIYPGIGSYTLGGGLGDDTYYGVTSATRIIEREGEGVDTVYVVSDYVMPDHVENMIVNFARAGVIGNGLANYIIGNSAAQSIDGGEGNDVMTGKGGGDTFVFSAKSGYDVITDFHAGTNTVAMPADIVRLTGYSQFKSFADVKAALTQVGNDVVLKLDAENAVKFADTKVEAFVAENFQLSLDVSKFKLAFSDDFNTLDAGSGDAATIWRTDYGFGGDTNGRDARTFIATGEKQVNVDPTFKGTGATALGLNPFSVDDGVLTIRSRPAAEADSAQMWGYKFTSGGLTTRNTFTQTYGYFEARLKLPPESPAFPAFWLYTAGTNASELDVMEKRASDSTWTATTHDYATGTHQRQSGAIFTPTSTSEFHNYGVLWTKETVTWYLDGVAVKTIDTPPDMHGPMYLIVNLAVDVSATADYQGSDLQIDYIRAYTLDEVAAEAGASVTGSVRADVLSDAAGAVTLTGMTGNDTYIVSTTKTRIVERSGEGTDLVKSAIDYVLGTNLENLTLTGQAVKGTGNDVNNVIIGNDRDNILIGEAGNDRLDGGFGADTLIGGIGNDTYIVDDAGDIVFENVGEGTDTVIANINYTLGRNIENLTLAGDALRGTGNELDNVLTGNASANILVGGAGNDRLDGGIGADTLIGETGNDGYYIDNAGDVIIEKAGEGFDMIWSSVDYIVPLNVEQLTLSGTAIRGTANDAGNYLYGNELANVLTGGAGNDVIDGKAGNDYIVGGAGNDKLTGGSGSDVFVFAGNFGRDVITDFKIGEDKVDWSALKAAGQMPVITDIGGIATVTFGTNSIAFTGLKAAELMKIITPKPVKALFGTDRDDTFFVTDADDFISEGQDGGTDTVYSAVDYTLGLNLENLFLTGTAIKAFGNDGKNVIVGNAFDNLLYGFGGNDVLKGGAGADTMYGGAGNDSYLVDDIGDKVIELLDDGIDTVSSSIDYLLGAHLENLTLTGGARVGTGNDLNNALLGNDLDNTLDGGAGNDRLDGGKGADRLIGGTGDDYYIVDNAGDVVIELAGGGHDIVLSSVDYTAPTNVEQLVLAGAATRGVAHDGGMRLYGNDNGNWLTGGLGGDIIKGGSGDDRIIGGAGNDTLIGGRGADTFVFGTGFGKDVINDFDVARDRIEWSGLTPASGIQTRDVNGNAVATIGSDTITFLGITAAELAVHHILM
ncbi:family 16 glycosylhydrolase [Sphingomonas sp. Leaf343]|uniref:family 16 glycosylhydrolase n=1 Tax=Sphingomonas sp. Leaf343 TaxID=1736345 RepID=UPI0006FAB618|nr:family 16 glycosylhydrolase [Sphingomonas sp. Leaf343]KQR80212.1 hypothetical protein ASG07_15575 [Sphingomonas sp. Leaf343]